MVLIYIIFCDWKYSSVPNLDPNGDARFNRNNLRWSYFWKVQRSLRTMSHNHCAFFDAHTLECYCEELLAGLGLCQVGTDSQFVSCTADCIGCVDVFSGWLTANMDAHFCFCPFSYYQDWDSFPHHSHLQSFVQICWDRNNWHMLILPFKVIRLNLHFTKKVHNYILDVYIQGLISLTVMAPSEGLEKTKGQRQKLVSSN